MGRRRELYSIATDIAWSLNSRNNDFQGYWATGQLHKLANLNHTENVKIDVINRQMEPVDDFHSGLVEMYRHVLIKQLDARKLSRDWVKSFILEYNFEQPRDESIQLWIGIGKPYSLRVLIESDVGRIHERVVGGYSRPHDPKREIRRTQNAEFL